MYITPIRSAVQVLVCLLLPLSLLAQKQEFEIIMMGDKIGTLTAERKVKGDIEMYSVTSSAQAKILWQEFSTATSTRVVFKGGVLSEAYYEYKDKGEIEKFCKVIQTPTGYSVNNWKKGKYTIDDMVNTCLAFTYFQEPKEGQKVFDETWGEYVNMKKTGSGQYEFKAKDGDRTVYHYSGGKLAEVEFHTSIMTVKMRPKA